MLDNDLYPDGITSSQIYAKMFFKTKKIVCVLCVCVFPVKEGIFMGLVDLFNIYQWLTARILPLLNRGKLPEKKLACIIISLKHLYLKV